MSPLVVPWCTSYVSFMSIAKRVVTAIRVEETQWHQKSTKQRG